LLRSGGGEASSGCVILSAKSSGLSCCVDTPVEAFGSFNPQGPALSSAR
jgi:hypothetical protein